MSHDPIKEPRPGDVVLFSDSDYPAIVHRTHYEDDPDNGTVHYWSNGALYDLRILYWRQMGMTVIREQPDPPPDPAPAFRQAGRNPAAVPDTQDPTRTADQKKAQQSLPTVYTDTRDTHEDQPDRLSDARRNLQTHEAPVVPPKRGSPEQLEQYAKDQAAAKKDLEESHARDRATATQDRSERPQSQGDKERAEKAERDRAIRMGRTDMQDIDPNRDPRTRNLPGGAKDVGKDAATPVEKAADAQAAKDKEAKDAAAKAADKNKDDRAKEAGTAGKR